MGQMAKRRDNTLMDSDQPVMLLAEMGVQHVKTKYTTAMRVQDARVLPLVERRAIDEARLLGEDGFYAWGEGKNRVEGPTVHLAMSLVRCYGNCAVDLGEVQENRDAWVFTATFVDLETGFTLARQFRQSKSWEVYGNFDPARKDDIRFQIGQSKAVRNVIKNALPHWLVRRMMDACKGGVREKIEKAIEQHGVEKVIERAISSLNAFGAATENILHFMGRKNAASLTVEDLVILSGCRAALESKQETADELFPPPVVATQVPEKGADALVNKLATAGKDATPKGKLSRGHADAQPTDEDLKAGQDEPPLL